MAIQARFEFSELAETIQTQEHAQKKRAATRCNERDRGNMIWKPVGAFKIFLRLASPIDRPDELDMLIAVTTTGSMSALKPEANRTWRRIGVVQDYLKLESIHYGIPCAGKKQYWQEMAIVSKWREVKPTIVCVYGTSDR